MIARPKISRNEWKTAEKGAFEVGNFALLSRPAEDREGDAGGRVHVAVDEERVGVVAPRRPAELGHLEPALAGHVPVRVVGRLRVFDDEARAALQERAAGRLPRRQARRALARARGDGRRGDAAGLADAGVPAAPQLDDREARREAVDEGRPRLLVAGQRRRRPLERLELLQRRRFPLLGPAAHDDGDLGRRGRGRMDHQTHQGRPHHQLLEHFKQGGWTELTSLGANA